MQNNNCNWENKAAEACGHTLRRPFLGSWDTLKFNSCMKRLPFFFFTLLAICLQSRAQYTPIVYGTLAVDDYKTVNRNYFTVPTCALNDGQAHQLSILELSREMAKAASTLSIHTPPTSSTPGAWFAPATLTNASNTCPGIPTARFKFSVAKYSPSPTTGTNKYPRMVVVRPNDNILRPCIMVSHGKRCDMGSYAQYLINGADYLLRGYVVAFYENSEALNLQVHPNLDCGSPFWPTFQNSLYQGYQYAVAATRYMQANSVFYGLDQTNYFATGISFGSICSMMLAYVDAGNFGNPIFNEPNGQLNFFARSFTNGGLPNIKLVAPIATAFPLPGAGNYVGDIFDASDASTKALFIHGRLDALFRLVNANNQAVTDFPAGCASAGVKVETPLALVSRMATKGLVGKAVIHCDADHASITTASFINTQFFADPFLSNIDFDNAPNSTFASQNEEWWAMSYMLLQWTGYSNIISQHFRSAMPSSPSLPSYTAPKPASTDGIDGVRPTDASFAWFPFVGANGTLMESSCGYNLGGVAFKQIETMSPLPPAAGFILAPNPTDGLVTIHLPVAAATDLQMEVYDLQGILVHRQWFPMGERIASMDLTKLPDGIYLLRLQDPDGKVETQKLIKQSL